MILVYINQICIQRYIYREYAKSFRDKKIYDTIPGKKYKRTNIVTGKCDDKIISQLLYNKIMDNASFHRKSKLYELYKYTNKNIKLIFLLPYSPELDPIEKFWAKLKKNLKRIDKNNKLDYYSILNTKNPK